MKRGIGAVLVAAVCALIPWAARAGTVEVTVAVPAGKSIASGTLIAEDQAIPLAAAGGKIVIKGLPDKRIPVTVDALVGADRHLGVAVVKTVKNKTVQAKVTIEPVTDIEAFCSTCHPNKGEGGTPGQVVRDTHVSGKELTGRWLAQVEKYNAVAEKLRSEKVKDAQLPMILEKRIAVVNGKEVVTYYYTCESCHTTHLKTPWARRVRAPYMSSSVLCEGCHY